MKMNCDIIQDLLPLYEDSLCSPASRAAVEDHLKTCQSCRALTGRDALLPPVAEPEPENADRAVVKSIKRVRRRWLRSLIAMALVVPMLLLSLNQFWGRGVCFTNGDDIFTAWRFIHALETGDWAEAAAMTTYGSDYDSIIDALSLPVESWGLAFRPVEAEGELLYVLGAADSFDSGMPGVEELFEYIYNCRGSAMLPLALWEQVIAVDPSSVEQDGGQYWVNGTRYGTVATEWGEFVITDGLWLDSAVEYCEQIHLVPAAVYTEAAGALSAMANETYLATHESIGYVGTMTKAEFEAYMTEKYAAELAELETLGIQIDCTGFESTYLLTPDGGWDVRFRVTITRGDQSLNAIMDLHTNEGHVELASLSRTVNYDWLDQVNRILYPSAHPNY